MDKDAKKLALTELKKLQKDLAGIQPDIPAIKTYLSSSPLFKRFLYTGCNELQVYYSNMTLTIYIKDGNILVNDKIDLWDSSGVGFIGSFTNKTLKLESSHDLD